MEGEAYLKAVSVATRAEMVEGFKNGKTATDLSNEFGYSLNLVRSVLRSAGCKRVDPMELRRFSWEEEARA